MTTADDVREQFDRERRRDGHADELTRFAELPVGDQRSAWSVWKAAALRAEVEALDGLTDAQRETLFTCLRVAGTGGGPNWTRERDERTVAVLAEELESAV